MVPSTSKKIYTWEEYNADIHYLASTIESTYKPSCIVGIARGGIIPAVHLSHLLNSPLHIKYWQTRDGGKRDLTPIPDRALIVDDICDSGLTFSSVVKACAHGEFKTAAIFESATAEYTVDFCINDNNEEWVVFPWEQ